LYMEFSQTLDGIWKISMQKITNLHVLSKNKKKYL